MSALADAFKQLIREVMAEDIGKAAPIGAQPVVVRPRGRPPSAPKAADAPGISTKTVADAIVKLATVNRPAAVAILTDAGVAKVSELKADQYKAVYDAAVAALAPPVADALA
jgi:hypothetical protein